MFNLWLELVKEIAKKTQDKKNNLVCPKCGNNSVDYQYIGDPVTRIGHLYIWCKICLIGVHMSRVSVPENASMLPLDISKEVLTERIPDFKQENLDKYWVKDRRSKK